MSTHPAPTAPRRRLRASLAVLAMIVAGIFVGVGPAAAATSGYVSCMNNTEVVGVWVNVSGGTSGWASRSGSGWQQQWSYGNTAGKSYSLTVGCGGTSQNWASSTYTSTYRTDWSNINCWPPQGAYGAGTGAVVGRCT